MTDWKDIGTLLLEYGMIKNEDLKEGMRLQKETGLRLGESLAKLGKVSMEDIEWVLSKQLDVPFVIVEDISVNTDLLKKFEKNFLIKNRILPLYETDDQISIVTDDPFNKPAIDVVSQLLKKKADVSTGSGKEIERLLRVSFEKVGLPELVDAISGLKERIRETSFYRIDFLLHENSCSIRIFGCGILRHAMTINGAFTKDDIFKAYNSLDTSFLYDEAATDNTLFLTTYPLENREGAADIPVVLGLYGLYLPEDIAFTDTRVFSTSRCFHSDKPTDGYMFLSMKRNGHGYEKLITTVDSVPHDLKECYVNAYIPRICSECGGKGCGRCKELGHEFEKIEGVYSSDDLKERMNEGYNGRN